MRLPDGFGNVGDSTDLSEGLIYEYVDKGEPKRRRDTETKPANRLAMPIEAFEYWEGAGDRESNVTKTHINRRFDDLQRTVCGMVGVLHDEVTALKSAVIASASEVDTAEPAKDSAVKIEELASNLMIADSQHLRDLFDLISTYELLPTIDVASAALEALKSEDGRLRASAASALGVLRPEGAMVPIAAAYEAEQNRHIKKIIGQSLKANMA